MRLTIVDEQHIRLETAPAVETTADGRADSGGSGAQGTEAGLAIAGGPFGPMQMLAASLALCTASVVHAYADTAGLEARGFVVVVRWEYADTTPNRIESFDLTIELPDTVAAARHRAVLRAAETCTVHNTLTHSPQVTATVSTLTSPHTPVQG